MSEYTLEIGDTIALVNMVREVFGKPMVSELPNATYGDPAACLFFRALSDCGATGVAGDTISFSSERQAALVADTWGVDRQGATVVTPRQFRTVVSAFDGNSFPFYNVDA